MNAKKKGNNTERVVCKLLSQWTGVEFNRVPLSGGLRWGDVSFITGDITPPSDFYFPFCVEVKSRRSLPLNIKHNGFLREKNVFSNFYKQSFIDCFRLNQKLIVSDLDTVFNKSALKQPIVFARANYMPRNFFFICTNPALSHALDIISNTFSSNTPTFEPIVRKQPISFPIKDINKIINTYYNIYKSTDIMSLNYNDLINIYCNYCLDYVT